MISKKLCRHHFLQHIFLGLEGLSNLLILGLTCQAGLPCRAPYTSDNPMIDYNRSSDQKGSISIDRSQNLALIMIEINSKRMCFVMSSWTYLDRGSFSPKTVPENVGNITYLVAEIANKCCWDESVPNRL